MAEFNINLSGPQAQGAQSVAPVQEAAERPLDVAPLAGIATVFKNYMVDKDKQNAENLKMAVVKEYVDNQGVYQDALLSGQWTASHVAMASRANYQKMRASYPQYITELEEARKSQFAGTETGEAQRKVDEAIKLRERDKMAASDMGYPFYEGMSPAAEEQTINLYKFTRQQQTQLEETRKSNAELRAQAGEMRAGESHTVTMKREQERQDAVTAGVAIMDRNFEQINTTMTDLMSNTTMPSEQKLATHKMNIARVKAGLAAVTATNPELASNWNSLLSSMDDLGQKMLDPKVKAEGEAKMLKDQLDSILLKAQILTLTKNPELVPFVVANKLFNDPTIVTLHGSAPIQAWLSGAGSGSQTLELPNIIGKPDEKKTLKMLEAAINKIETNPNKEQATQEAVNAANVIMKQTQAMTGEIGPAKLKDLSTFYSSAAFGKIASTGKVDMNTMQNVKEVFQVKYEPAVRAAIMDKLNTVVSPETGETLLNSVDLRFSGSGVVMVKKGKDIASNKPFISGFVASGMRGVDIIAGQDAVKSAEAGLNQVIRMGAHMEGSTDYGKYWEANKHYILPTVFPDPNKLKPGDVKKGYKYKGGPVGNESSWERVK